MRLIRERSHRFGFGAYGERFVDVGRRMRLEEMHNREPVCLAWWEIDFSQPQSLDRRAAQKFGNGLFAWDCEQVM